MRKDGEVICLRINTAPQDALAHEQVEPVEGVIEQLEEMLTLAKDGKLRAFSMAALDDRGIPRGFTRGEIYLNGPGLIGAVHLMLAALTTDIEATGIPAGEDEHA